jgi:hypothetical protein
MGESGEGRPGDPGGRGVSWVEKNLGPGWVEVEPGIYRYSLSEVRPQHGLRLAPPDEEETDDPRED